MAMLWYDALQHDGMIARDIGSMQRSEWQNIVKKIAVKLTTAATL